MKTIFERIFCLSRTSKNHMSDNRRYVRISHEQDKPKSITLINSKYKRISAELKDLSVDGCRILVSNMNLFEATTYVLEFKKEEFGLSGLMRVRVKVVWTELHQVDLTRFCSVGLRFISDELPDLSLHQQNVKELRFNPNPIIS